MKKKNLFIVGIILFLCMIFNVSTVNATSDERITGYDVEIYLNEDASMEVTEKINVYAAKDQIKHGIYRDFPTEYDNKKIKFDVKEVLCDGEDTEYSLESVDRGVRIKIGDANKFVSTGFHTYTIKYETERQIAFEEDYDELYWNVIGSGWLFPIEYCHAKVYFPNGTKFLEDDLETYTGKFGNKGEVVNVYTDIIEEENAVDFTIYEILNKGEAFTISVKIEKGTLIEPSMMQKFSWFIEDNVISIVIFILLLFLIVWQIYSWKKHGEDPKANVIIPRYFPPEGLSPADVKYIEKMGGMDKVLEASIIDLAVKGYLKFTKKSEKSKKIIIEKNTDIASLPELDDIEKKIYDSLNSKEFLEYSSTFQKKIQLLKASAEEKLADKFKNKLFFNNNKEFIKSIIISVLIFIISIIVGFGVNKFATQMYITRLTFIIPLIIILTIPISAFISIKKMEAKTLVKVLFGLLFAVPFLIVIVTTVIMSLESILEIGLAAWAVGMLVLDNVVFYKLIRRYSEEGLRVKEEIEGFKMFIETAKDDDFQDKTPEMFDKYFPYAYVLGLENKWASKFEDVLEAADYVPTWCSPYMYHNGMFDVVVFTNSFSSSFSSGMSSASTAPSSSGGSGGGGFSGGGGRWPAVEAAGKPLNQN